VDDLSEFLNGVRGEDVLAVPCMVASPVEEFSWFVGRDFFVEQNGFEFV